jgi:hypothetical protein
MADFEQIWDFTGLKVMFRHSLQHLGYGTPPTPRTAEPG